MNSVIEAQLELKEAVTNEINRCLDDVHYFYLNYYRINGEKPILSELDKMRLNKVMKLYKSNQPIIFHKGRSKLK